MTKWLNEWLNKWLNELMTLTWAGSILRVPLYRTGGLGPDPARVSLAVGPGGTRPLPPLPEDVAPGSVGGIVVPRGQEQGLPPTQLLSQLCRQAVVHRRDPVGRVQLRTCSTVHCIAEILRKKHLKHLIWPIKREGVKNTYFFFFYLQPRKYLGRRKKTLQTFP